MRRQRRIVLMLATSQALFQTTSVMIMTVGGLAGQLIAPDPGLATLPIACVALGAALMTLPASLLMGRIGRRPGFVLGAALGVVGGAMAAAAMMLENFLLLCAGTGLVGAYQGFAQFYRFAAGEEASPEFRSRAISYVLAGGIVAALAGPHLGAATRDLFGVQAYAGSFLAVLALSAAAAALLAATPLQQPNRGRVETGPARRPLARIARQPRFIAAVVGAAAGFGVMVMVMTATPLSMVAHGHQVSTAAVVIQWHVLGMFVPSFFTGGLVRRFGVLPMMGCGLALLGGHVAIALSGLAFAHFLSGLILLGVGWNLLYVGGSTLLTETYEPSERALVQGLNDFLIVGVVAVGSFSAGLLADLFGWRGVNLAAVPVLLLAFLALANAARRPALAGPSAA